MSEFQLGEEIDLLVKYPKANRNLDERAAKKSEEDRKIARKFGKEFFDGDRKHGYGGFSYNPKYWSEVVKTFRDYWNLSEKSSLLDVGCAKGFMINDFKKLIPKMKVAGIDISEYAINNSMTSVKKYLSVSDAKSLPYDDDSFDYVISINTIHNLEKKSCGQALREIQRVSKLGAFITVDAFHNEDEKERMYKWNLTAKTIMSVNEWKKFFKENHYSGSFFWFIP